MSPRLPDDVLFLISAQLAEQRDFSTLFNCSLASRILAAPALRNLYRVQDGAPVKNGGTDDAQPVAVDAVARWAKLWRSLILSSISKTIFPYCRYMRVLDLNDLAFLLQDNKFRDEYSKDFFEGDLKPFLVETEADAKTRKAVAKRRLSDKWILDLVGESLSAHAPMVEELITGHHSAEISRESLIKWIPRMRHLRRLQLFDGSRLRDAGPMLKDNCREFRALRVYRVDEEASTIISEAIKSLLPNTLALMEIFSSAQLGNDFFASLDHHSASLSELNLGDIDQSCLVNLVQLKNCTTLKKLKFKVTGRREDSPEFLLLIPEIVDWLQSCKGLEELSFESFNWALLILTPLLLHPHINLKQLSLVEYEADRAIGFHRVLAHQSQSLRSLTLQTDGEFVEPDALKDVVSKLTLLTELRLPGVSDYFLDEHLKELAETLPYLEDLSISGWRITDAIWTSFNQLGSLRKLDMNAFSAFTLEGILEFISNLTSGNQGLSLAIMMADPRNALSEQEQQFIKENLAQQVEGKFEYQLARDPDAEESDSDSD